MIRQRRPGTYAGDAARARAGESEVYSPKRWHERVRKVYPWDGLSVLDDKWLGWGQGVDRGSEGGRVRRAEDGDGDLGWGLT